MSLPEGASETRVQQDDSNQEDRKDVTVKDFKTNQVERRTASPLTLLREDINQFKDEVLKVFKDKDTKTEIETENKAAVSTLSLLKDDLSQMKEDVSSIFSIKDLKSTERTANPLSLIKEDLSSVFRISLHREKDNSGLTVKEDPSKIKVLSGGRSDDPIKKLFRRDKTQLRTAKDSEGVKTSKNQVDEGFRKKMSNQNEETVESEKAVNTVKDGKKDLEDRVNISMSEEKSETTPSLSRTQQRENEETCPSLTADQRGESDNNTVVSNENQTEEDGASVTPQVATLLSELSLFSLTVPREDDMRKQLEGDEGRERGDLWSLKNYACYLTFDPSTANSELHLTECNRKATRVWSENRCLDHLDRFEHCPQVLCREGLLDCVYWEVEWRGGADIGVTYNSISRDGKPANCLLGHNEVSWSLECSEGSYTPCYNNKRFRSSSPKPFSHRVGVYLNWSAGSLSFYCISQDAMVHLHTFSSTFTEPLYPGFWVWAYDGSVSLCQVELDWERLLQ